MIAYYQVLLSASLKPYINKHTQIKVGKNPHWVLVWYESNTWFIVYWTLLIVHGHIWGTVLYNKLLINGKQDKHNLVNCKSGILVLS